MILLATGNRVLAPSQVGVWRGRVRTEIIEANPRIVLHSDIPGIDAMVDAACKDAGYDNMIFRTMWEEHRGRATQIRNKAIVSVLRGFMDGGYEVKALIFCTDRNSNDGTGGIINLCLKHNIPTSGVTPFGRKYQFE